LRRAAVAAIVVTTLDTRVSVLACENGRHLLARKERHRHGVARSEGVKRRKHEPILRFRYCTCVAVDIVAGSAAEQALRWRRQGDGLRLGWALRRRRAGPYRWALDAGGADDGPGACCCGGAAAAAAGCAEAPRGGRRACSGSGAVLAAMASR
jgi:hypothetical protein